MFHTSLTISTVLFHYCVECDKLGDQLVFFRVSAQLWTQKLWQVISFFKSQFCNQYSGTAEGINYFVNNYIQKTLENAVEALSCGGSHRIFRSPKLPAGKTDSFSELNSTSLILENEGLDASVLSLVVNGLSMAYMGLSSLQISMYCCQKTY